MSATLRIETIGKCVAYVGDRRIDQTAEVLLAGALLLGLEPGKKRIRTETAEWLWPEASNAVRGTRLRWLLSKLRGFGLALSADGVHFSLDPKFVSCDADAFGASPCSVEGPVLAGYDPRISEPFERWLQDQRVRLRLQVVGTLGPSLAAAALRADWAAAARIAGAIRVLDPHDQEAALQLVEAHSRLGDRRGALELLQSFSAGVDGDGEFLLRARLLEQRIRSSEDGVPRGEPRFVGRHEQLRAIDALLNGAQQGRGGSLLLSGPAGIGKTRLLDEARTRASMQRIQTTRIRCHRGDSARPLSGILELVQAVLDLPGALGCDPSKLQFLRQLTAGDAPGAASEAGAQKFGWVKRRLVHSLSDLLASVSDESPLCIQVDDVQWAEAAVQWFWNPLISCTAEYPVVWLFAYRTAPKTRCGLDALQVAVPALDLESARQLLDELLSSTANTNRLDRPTLLARGAGSPLFLRELARHCANHGTTDQLPDSLLSLLGIGIAGLSKHGLRVLQVAAVLGSYATLSRIDAVACLDRTQFLDAITELETAGILAADISGAVIGHVLWAEAAMDRLTPNVARLLHRHAAEQLEEELRHATNSPLLWECSRQWELAGDVERARKATIAGAEALARLGFGDDAVSGYTRAIGLAVDPSEKLRLIDRRIQLMDPAGHWREMEAAIDEFDALSTELQPGFDGHTDHEIRRLRARAHLTGNAGPLMEAALRCASSPRASSRHRLLAARECAWMAEAFSAEILSRVHDAVVRISPQTPTERWELHSVRVAYSHRIGDLAELRRLAALSMPLALEHPEPGKRPIALAHQVQACALIGELDEARRLSHERIALAKSLGYTGELLAGYDVLIGIELDSLRLDTAERLLNEVGKVLELSDRYTTMLQSLMLRGYLGQLAAMRHEWQRALELALPIPETTRHPNRCRARLLAVRLAATMAIGSAEEAEASANLTMDCFDENNRWMDWPASVCASYLFKRSADEAASFVGKYLSELRREAYPAPEYLSRYADVVISKG